MRLRESGILDHLIQKYKKNVDKCKLKNMDKQSSAGNPLSLYAMDCAFVVLGVGVGLSLVAFVLELIIHRASSSRRKRISAPIALITINPTVMPTILVLNVLNS